MPGMMDTILELGINDAVERTLSAAGDAAFAADTRDVSTICTGESSGESVSADPSPVARLKAVFDSWNSPRAGSPQPLATIGNQGGTAIVVQAMVFGNNGPRSGSGALFGATR